MMCQIWSDVKTGHGRSVGRIFCGNVVTDFIPELPTLFPSYRLYSHGTSRATACRRPMNDSLIRRSPPLSRVLRQLFNERPVDQNIDKSEYLFDARVAPRD